RGGVGRVVGCVWGAVGEGSGGGDVGDGTRVLEGRAAIVGAASAAGRTLAWLIGFPAASADLPVSVEMRVDESGEVWTRNFGGKKFRSRLAPIAGRRNLITEKFRWLTFDLALTANPAGLDLKITGGRVGPLRLPRFLLPRSQATERVDARGRFCFDVPIAMPVVGLLVHYRGWLVPRPADALPGAADAAVVAAT